MAHYDIVKLVVLGIALGLDSLRASVGLGALGLPSFRHWQIPLMFGICDSLAPLSGLAIGGSLVDALSPEAQYLGPVVLGICGVYVIYRSLRRAESEPNNHLTPRLILGLPVVFSLDNFVAGVGLGILGLSVIFSAMLFGLISGLMSAMGLQLGTFVRYITIKVQLLSSVVVLLMALTFTINRF